MIKFLRPVLIVGFALWAFRLAYQLDAQIDALFALFLSFSIYLSDDKQK